MNSSLQWLENGRKKSHIRVYYRYRIAVAVPCATDAEVKNLTLTYTPHFIGTNIGHHDQFTAHTEYPESVHHVDPSTDVSIPTYHGAFTHDVLDTEILAPHHLVICTPLE